jgi:CMP-N-acetylneuraminic acid synthetase
MKKIAVVINARVHSTRVSCKLIRPFGDSTLLDIALNKLVKIEADEKYIAACEDDIISIYERYKDNVDLILREKESVKKGENPHLVSFAHYGKTKSKWIMVMNPCLPFTTVNTYNSAINYFKHEHNIKTATSVVKDNNMYFNSSFQPINLKDKDFISSRNTVPIYKMANVYHIIDRDYFLSNGKFWNYSTNNPKFILVDPFECFDIDTQKEFDFCNKLYNSVGMNYGKNNSRNRI